ncbi:hypothetical protein [Glutamicibacter halophytocola]|uniref:hypothetical protein n=1 Tax=Glutamicibacter halophytocola TaxID=1933880 RepID=UPI003D2D949C
MLDQPKQCGFGPDQAGPGFAFGESVEARHEHEAVLINEYLHHVVVVELVDVMRIRVWHASS